MKITDKENISEWAYNQCKEGNDTKEVRDLITNSFWANMYCFYIKDRPELRKYITNKIDLKILKERRENEINK